jgi:15-cis-phytoene synthase
MSARGTTLAMVAAPPFLVLEGYQRSREVTRRHAKSFFFSSVMLFGQRRQAAFALYAFCRRLDDLVDGENRGDGTVSAPDDGPAQLAARLSLARDAVNAQFDGSSAGLALQHLPWPEAELAAFKDTVARYRLSSRPFLELIDGMQMDLTRSRYETFEELHQYCYRVAGVVGEMMTPVLGHADDRCLPYAAELGVAMQLTNILRDVKEDLLRGRLYLPRVELEAFGVDVAALEARAAGQPFTEAQAQAWAAFMRFQLARARALYRRSLLGVPDLRGFGSQRVVRLMSAVYGGILEAIEARGYDVFSSRAHVPLAGKLARALAVLLRPPTSGLPSQPVDLPALNDFVSPSRQAQVLPTVAVEHARGSL